MYVKNTIFFAIVLGLMIFALNFVMNIPDVHKSYSSGECIKVINYNKLDSYTCEDMPERYDVVWVK